MARVEPGRGVLAAVLLCFLLSGFAGLLYQTAWTREFAFVFGTSELAVAVVLAGYMGGLAAGAAIAARWVNAVRRPVLAYGLLELGVAVAALAVPYCIEATMALSKLWFGRQSVLPEAGSLWVSLFQLSAALLILFVPTALMGATLPLLARHAVHEDRHVGPRVALLYSTNTAGAVLGTIVTAFVLLPSLGLRQTVYVGVAINALVFALAAAISRATGAASAHQFALSPDQRSVETLSAAPRRWRWSRESWVLPLVFAGGGVSFVYEVLWTRLLSQVLGGSVYAFATMLASFLAGIALGSAAAAPLARSRRRAALGLAAAELGVALMARAAFLGLDRIPDYAHLFGGGTGFAPGRDALLSSLVLLPSTTFLGATFPFAVRVLARSEIDAAAASARVYAWNTVGGVAGALAGGFFLLPELGFAGTLDAISAGNAALAVLACLLVAPPPRVALALAAAATLALGWIRSEEPWRLVRVMALGGDVMSGDIAFFRVGRSATVLLTTVPEGWRITTNGLPESSIHRTERHQGMLIARWLSALPALLRPDAERLLVVGLGGGVAVEYVPRTISEIEVVELEPAVVEANRTVGLLREADPLADARLRVVVNDVRGALALTDRKWDVISSQPSHPWTPGASHLYTREFAALAREHLRPGGVFVQWISAPFADLALLRSLLASIRAEFPYVAAYAPEARAGFLMVGSDRPVEADAGGADAIERSPIEFAQAGILVPEDATMALVVGSDRVDDFIAGAEPVTDDFNSMMTHSPRLLGQHEPSADLYRELKNYEPLASPRGASFDPAYTARRLLREKRMPERARAIADTYRDRGAETLVLRGMMEQARGDLRWAEQSYAAALAAEPRSRTAAAALADLRALQGRRPSPVETASLAAAGRATLEGERRAAAGDWTGLRALDPELAMAEPRESFFARASRLRARWRIEDGDSDGVREAFAILRRSLWVSEDAAADLILRARASVVLRDLEQATSDLGAAFAVARPQGLSRASAAEARAVLASLPLGEQQAERTYLAQALQRAERGEVGRRAPQALR